MLQSEVLNDPDSAPEGGCYPGFDDMEYLSIDIDTLFQILDEDKNSSSNSEDLTSKNFDAYEFPCAPVKYEKDSRTQDVQPSMEASSLEDRMLGPIPSCSAPFEAYNSMDKDLSYPYEYPGNFNFSELHSVGGHDQGKVDMSLWSDDKYPLCSDALTLAPDWLNLTRSSSEHDNPPWQPASSGNALTSNSIDNQLLQNGTPNWTFQSKISSGEADHHSEYTSYPKTICLGSEIGYDFGLTKDETSYRKEVKSDAESCYSYGTVLANGTADLRVQQGNICTYPRASFSESDVSLHVSPHSNLDNGRVTAMKCEASGNYSPGSFCGDFTSNTIDASFSDHSLGQIFSGTYHRSSASNDEQTMKYIKNEEDGILLIPQSTCSSNEMNFGVQEGSLNVSQSATLLANADIFISNVQRPELNKDNSIKWEASVHHSPVSFGRNCVSDAYAGNSADHSAGKVLPPHQALMSHKNPMVCIKDERRNEQVSSHSTFDHFGKGIDECEKSLSRDGSYDDSDADLCILEEISDPRHPPPMVEHGKSYTTSQRSTFSETLHNPGIGGMRFKANAERLAFQAALQDLSQTKSEASPPDGLLAVPLLRHQRIALSWMVQKETATAPMNCFGGILADDQGLGKTISTIALILLERSPQTKSIAKAVEQSEFKALNLDDDDDDGVHAYSLDAATNRGTVNSQNSSVAGKGRPAAGTLVVCPTSVLRQWAEELQNKVTREANLSVLVYHGSNRTKDPDELAKHDVVLTTYSIVSMEVPKQPLVDQDDEEKGKPVDDDLLVGPSTSRKRKDPPSKKNSKKKKVADGALLESAARPLARVRWFRVILDEAQSIKNHRTQVARACWGLRAKRRWCLSGTPIQNAVDDLYSYFRFLRYEPYAAYKSFCSSIKAPIHRNPTHGYKRLQAVLKTVMLRRTKGTLIDGEPIINLPPKTVSLKKVDFSEEERDFYSRLEADSRAQFKVYAEAGTVKQNYVNILLMLLRLRQACDHPLLVKGYDSNSVWKSSVETAKKLPREKQMELLNCLEACFAICNICNDPPEDAVVTVCGHVFCNQCICEHLTGDEYLCPDCKEHLGVTSVFSKATLKTSLSDNIGRYSSPDGAELFSPSELWAEARSSDSSKIKAALEILQSLSKPNLSSERSCGTSTDKFSTCSESAADSILGVESNIHDKSHLDMSKGSTSPVAEKAIVFSQWTRMLDLLESRLKSSSIQYRRLDGTMSVVARDKAVKDFNNLPEVSVMIMSLKAASLGLNMVAACHVLLLDLWWNPTTEDQAIDRAHRIGQTRPVTVSRLTVKDTVEDRILALQQKKREMVASAFGEDETGSRQTRLTVEDLEYLFMA